MSLTFENLIAHNRRFSVLLVLAIGALLALLCGSIGFALAGPPADEAFLSGVFLGTGLALGGGTLSYYAGAMLITGLSGARRMVKADDPELFNVVEEMAIAAGLPLPQIYLIRDDSPNAFATGRNPEHAIVGITTGLRNKLDRDELQAVIAHEMAHIKNYDIRLMMLVAAYAGIIVLICDFFVRSFMHGMRMKAGARGGHRSGSGGAIQAVGFILAVVLFAWIAPALAKILQLAVSREREYLADVTAVQLCRNPEALIGALKKISMDPLPLACDNRATEHLFIINPNPKFRLLNPNHDSIWATHPPLGKRIQRIAGLLGTRSQPGAGA